jgi:hypothetical protein
LLHQVTHRLRSALVALPEQDLVNTPISVQTLVSVVVATGEEVMSLDYRTLEGGAYFSQAGELIGWDITVLDRRATP